MKLKFKQSAYIVSLNKLVSVKEEIDIDNVEFAQELITAGYAEEVIVEQNKSPKTSDEVVKEVKQPVEKKGQPKQKKVGE